MLKHALKDVANWQIKRQSNCAKFRPPCLDDHQLKQEESETTGELSKDCSHIVLKCLYLARTGRPDTLWSVNKLARAITKWINACDRRLARLISYNHHTSEYRQCCHVGNSAQHCRLGLFQDSDFAAVEHLSPSAGCTRSKLQSHTCLQKLIFFSLYAGLRMDGLPALDLWDVVIEVLRSPQDNATSIVQAAGNRRGTEDNPKNTSKSKQKKSGNVVFFLCESSFYELAFL